jgi:hypothetical protein
VEVNRRPKKGEILLRELELVASSCGLRPCDEKTTAAVIAPIAPISPFMAAMNPVPDCQRAFRDRSTEP